MIFQPVKLFACLFFLTCTMALAQTPKLIIDNKGHTGLINKILFLDGGRKIVSISNDKTVRLWDVNTGGLIKTFYVNQSDGYHGRIYSAALSVDEKTLAIGGFFGKAGGDSTAVGSIYLIPLENPSEIKQLKGHTNVVTDLVSTGNKLISTSADKKVKVWSFDNAQPRLLFTFGKHRYPISRVAYSNKNKRIASADVMGNVLIWNIETGEIVTDKIGKFHEGPITSITFSDDETMLFTGGEDGKLIKWTSTGKFLEVVSEEGKPVNAILSIKGSSQLLYLSTKGKIKDLGTGKDLLNFNAHNNTVSAAAIAPFIKFAEQPGTYVATAGGDEKEIYIWNTADGKVVRKFAGGGHGIFSTGNAENNMSFAFGQSNPTEILEDAPLEKRFSLMDFSLADITDKDQFRKYDRDYLGSKIYKEGTHTLNYGSGNITIDPQKDGEIRSYTFINEHNTIAIGSTFGIPLFERTGALLGRLVGHHGEVWSVCPFGNDLLLSSSSDQTVKIWNYKTKELLLTFFPANDREWVLWSPSGYYHASAGGEKYIGWLINKKANQLAEFHEVSEFRNKFHKPELIKAIFREKSLQAAAQKLNIEIPKEEDVIKLLPPSVTWLHPASFTSTTDKLHYNIQAFIQSNNPLKNIKLMVNGRPVVTRVEDFKTEKKDNGITISYNLDFNKINFQSRGLEVVPASEVENQKKDIMIQLFVENEVSGMVTEPRTVFYKSGNENKVSPQADNKPTSTLANTDDAGNLYIVSIGISDFKNASYNLNYADDDATAIEKVFKDQQGKLFNKVYTFPLINENATRAKILTTFERVKQIATPKDFVIIFIATHGINRDNQFYILPHDGDAAKANITCVNWRDFSNVVGNLPSQVLLLIDACHSGQLGKNMGQVSSDNTEAVREIASAEYGVVIMAASTGSEYSLEHKDWAHGAFTLSLIEGLEKRKADIRQDGIVYIRELDFYVAERVKDLTQNQQHPTTQKPSSISTMPIIKYQ